MAKTINSTHRMAQAVGKKSETRCPPAQAQIHSRTGEPYNQPHGTHSTPTITTTIITGGKNTHNCITHHGKHAKSSKSQSMTRSG